MARAEPPAAARRACRHSGHRLGSW